MSWLGRGGALAKQKNQGPLEHYFVGFTNKTKGRQRIEYTLF